MGVKTIGGKMTSPLKANTVTTVPKAVVGGIIASPTPSPATLVPMGLFTPKPGGTVLGNALRDVVGTVSEGHFGDGSMKQKDGETSEQYQNRLVQAAGAAAEAFKNTSQKSSNSTDMADSFKSGVTEAAITNAVKTYAPTVILVGLGIFVVKKYVLKKGRSSKRRY